MRTSRPLKDPTPCFDPSTSSGLSTSGSPPRTSRTFPLTLSPELVEGSKGSGSGLAPAVLGLIAVLIAAPGCRQDMHDQPKYLPLAPSDFFADGRSSRPQVAGTVARGQPILDEVPLYTGRVGTEYVRRSPVAVTETLLRRGRERYDIFCAVCHDRVGSGDGMIVQRGFRRPEPFNVERLRDAPDGYFFDVMTNGFGVMPSYASQVAADDRWAIVAYVRALQLAQGAALADVPPAERATLERMR